MQQPPPLLVLCNDPRILSHGGCRLVSVDRLDLGEDAPQLLLDLLDQVDRGQVRMSNSSASLEQASATVRLQSGRDSLVVEVALLDGVAS